MERTAGFSSSDEARLFIFPPSSGCELAVWLLQLYGIPTRINSQTAPFFQISIKLRGGSHYPFLLYKCAKLSGSLAIANGLEELLPADKRLYPSKPAEHDQAKALLNDFIGPYLAAVPGWVYYWLLPHRSLLVGPISKGVPWWQKLLVRVAYRPIAWLIGRSLKLGKGPPDKDLALIQEVFDRVDALLADGRQFLVGDKLSTVDVGFAALAAPAVLEPRYGNGGLLPTLEQAPPGMRPVVTELRNRPAGKFVARIYQSYR